MKNLDILIIYAIITLTYCKHIFIKGKYDFLLLCVLYLVMGTLYENREFPNNNNEYSKKYKLLMSFLYQITALIFLKHQFMCEKYDYVVMAIAYLVAGIIKYNLMCEKNSGELSMLQKINVFADICTALIFGKNVVVNEPFDYVLLALSYGTYGVTEYLLM